MGVDTRWARWRGKSRGKGSGQLMGWESSASLVVAVPTTGSARTELMRVLTCRVTLCDGSDDLAVRRVDGATSEKELKVSRLSSPSEVCLNQDKAGRATRLTRASFQTLKQQTLLR